MKIAEYGGHQSIIGLYPFLSCTIGMWIFEWLKSSFNNLEMVDYFYGFCSSAAINGQYGIAIF
jgi:hypothetical protein